MNEMRVPQPEQVAATKADFLIRVRTGNGAPKFPVLRRLPDGSWLSRFGGVPVRVIDASWTVTTSAGRLFDGRVSPACAGRAGGRWRAAAEDWQPVRRRLHRQQNSVPVHRAESPVERDRQHGHAVLQPHLHLLGQLGLALVVVCHLPEATVAPGPPVVEAPVVEAPVVEAPVVEAPVVEPTPSRPKSVTRIFSNRQLKNLAR